MRATVTGVGLANMIKKIALCGAAVAADLTADFKLDLDGDGYVNLQEYLDEVGAFPAPTPLTYVGPSSGSSARYALITNWKTSDFTTSDPMSVVLPGSNWQPSRFDEAREMAGLPLGHSRRAGSATYEKPAARG